MQLNIYLLINQMIDYSNKTDLKMSFQIRTYNWSILSEEVLHIKCLVDTITIHFPSEPDNWIMLLEANRITAKSKTTRL